MSKTNKWSSTTHRVYWVDSYWLIVISCVCGAFQSFDCVPQRMLKLVPFDCWTNEVKRIESSENMSSECDVDVYGLHIENICTK